MFSGPAGVFRHAEVVEDAAGIAVEPAHGGGDAAVAVGADDADGEAAQAGGVLGAVAGPDAQAVLVEGVVEDVVDGLDLPVAAVEKNAERFGDLTAVISEEEPKVTWAELNALANRYAEFLMRLVFSAAMPSAS